jgi:hypothetical protein
MSALEVPDLAANHDAHDAFVERAFEVRPKGHILLPGTAFSEQVAASPECHRRKSGRCGEC